MISVPTSYEAAREEFYNSLPIITNHWRDAQLTSHPLPDDPTLTTDIIHAHPGHKHERLLILTTGLHGIEGYIGAGVLRLFMNEYLRRLDPQTTGLLLVHAINPYGMQRRIRVNKHNVDLNRNFETQFETLHSLNPHYESLSDLLYQRHPLGHPLAEKTAFLWKVLKALPRGIRHIRETTLMGQYRHQNGVYFGGFHNQHETLLVQQQVAGILHKYTHIVLLDMHTGYGPRWQMTLVNPPSQRMSSSETAMRYQFPRVAGTNPEEFYTIHGDMVEYFHKLVELRYPEKTIYAAAFEFGTYGDSLPASIRSLRSTVLENGLRHLGASKSGRRWIRREYDELFMPADKKWLEKAAMDARQAFNGILAAEGFFVN